MNAALNQLQERVCAAAESATPLCIVGTGSKGFYGEALVGEPLSTAALNGIVDYEPAELVITALSGTSLAEIEAALAARGQMLAFDPPRFGDRGTLGGAVAAGLSGPRRAYAGAVRDYVLGVRMIDGQGRTLRFGGQVIKNVAGFDVSRLMAGSLGTLGLLTEITLKTLPRPAAELSLMREADEATAIRLCNEWGGRPLPLSATCHMEGRLYVRLSGAHAAVKEARAQLGGELVPNDQALWDSLRDHSHGFFAAEPLWRISLPATTAPLNIDLPQLSEWGGALRWVTGNLDHTTWRERLGSIGGHLTLFRSNARPAPVFQPMAPGIDSLHRRLKHAFDPQGIFNRGRMYPHF